MTKMGRPPKAEGQKQDSLIRFRVRRADRDVMEAAAEHAGLSLSAWARAALLRLARRELRKR